MTEPIKAKPKSSMKIDNAPTPHNTPASVMGTSFLKNGNPVSKEATTTNNDDAVPTIHEEDLQNVLSEQPLFLQSIQDKLGSLIGQNSGYVNSLPKDIKDRIFALKKIQSDLFILEKDFQIEMFELEQKYLKKYKPLHEHRSDLINGNKEPTKEEIEEGKKIDEDAEEEGLNDIEEEEQEEEEKEKGIPSFWLTALENLPIVSDTITDRDTEVLESLNDIELEYLNDGRPGFKIVFKFDQDKNEFFKNKTLTKTYYYQKELGYSGDFIYDYAEGEDINWIDNNSNVTVSVEMRKQRNKSTKQVRTIEKITPVESFFNFFDPPKMKNHDCESHGEHEHDDDEDDEEDLEQRLALDYSIGEQLKDKLIPRAVDWFTGTALEYEYDGDMGEGEFDEYEDDEEDDDNDEDDDEVDEMAGTATEPPECKQS